jgi:uncharacterized membrane protein
MKWITVILCLCVVAVGLSFAIGHADSAQVVAVSATEGQQIQGGQSGCGQNVAFTTAYCDGGSSYCPGSGYEACPSFPHAYQVGYGSGKDVQDASADCFVCGAQLVQCGSVTRDSDYNVCN